MSTLKISKHSDVPTALDLVKEEVDKEARRIFSAGGDTMFDFYSLAVCMWGLAVPCALISAFWLHWHVLIVYSCTCLDEVGKIPWVMHHYRKYKWVKNLTR